MKPLRCFAVFLGLFCCLRAEDPKFDSIFTGTDLSGWKVPHDNIWWSGTDGILAVKNDPTKNGSISWAEKVYKNFIGKAENDN